MTCTMLTDELNFNVQYCGVFETRSITALGQHRPCAVSVEVKPISISAHKQNSNTAFEIGSRKMTCTY